MSASDMRDDNWWRVDQIINCLPVDLQRWQTQCWNAAG